SYAPRPASEQKPHTPPHTRLSYHKHSSLSAIPLILLRPSAASPLVYPPALPRFSPLLHSSTPPPSSASSPLLTPSAPSPLVYPPAFLRFSPILHSSTPPRSFASLPLSTQPSLSPRNPL